MQGSIMEEAKADVGAEQIPEASESLFSMADVVVLALIIGAIGFWLVKRNNRPVNNLSMKSYTIQWVSTGFTCFFF